MELLFDRIKRAFRRRFAKSDKPTSDNRILLIPPTPLDGSFGDELMVVTFLEQFRDFEVDLFAEYNNRRPDIFGNYRVNYLKWNQPLDWSKYQGAYILGADNMTGAYGTTAPLFKLSTLKNGNEHGVPIFVLGFSINENIHPEVVRAMQELLPHTHFFLREAVSIERSHKFLPDDNVHVVADLAFLCKSAPSNDIAYNPWGDEQKKVGKIILAICPNAIQAGKVGIEPYLHGITEMLTQASLPLACVCLYHDIRLQCEGKYSDVHISEMLYQRLNGRLPVYFQGKIRDGITLKSYLYPIDLTLTGRMHFGISGLSLNKPMFGLAYEGKFDGLQHLFGIDPEKSLAKNLHALSSYGSMFDEFIRKLESNKSSIENR